MAVSPGCDPDGKLTAPTTQPADEPDFLPTPEDGASLVRAILQIRSPERLRAILEYVKANEILISIADGIYALDANWRFVYFNDPAEILLKLQREKVMGRLFFDVFPELLESAVHDNYRRVMDERTPLQFEMRSRSRGALDLLLGLPHARWRMFSLLPRHLRAEADRGADRGSEERGRARQPGQIQVSRGGEPRPAPARAVAGVVDGVGGATDRRQSRSAPNAGHDAEGCQWAGGSSDRHS